MPSGGKLIVRTENVVLEAPFVERELAIPPGRYATLRVTDNGVGMSEEILSRDLRTVLHDEGAGQGDRARPGDGLRDRKAERRVHPRLQRFGQGDHFHGLPPRDGGDGKGSGGGARAGSPRSDARQGNDPPRRGRGHGP